MSRAAALSEHGPTLSFWPSPRRWGSTAILVVAIAAAFATTIGADHLVNWGGWTLAWRFASAAFHPALDTDILKLTATSTAATVAFALCGSALNLVIGCTCGLLASEAWWDIVGLRPGRRRNPLRWLAPLFRAGVAFPRGIHELVWGLFLIAVMMLRWTGPQLLKLLNRTKE